MSDRAYRTLLLLLPRHRRRRYGDEMTAVFADVRAEARRRRGLRGVAVAWMKETRDVLRSAVRQRVRKESSAAPKAPRPGSGPGYLTELHWAWRGVRSRGWRLALMVVLGTVTLAANATMFAVTDALVFNAFPFPSPERIVELEATLADDANLTREQRARQLDEWKKQTDIFEAAGGYRPKTLFVLGEGGTERVPTADVTVGFFGVLGVRPRWGRDFVPGDELGIPEFAVTISDRLARRLYGGPGEALGQVLQTTAAPHRVVGVMDPAFAFPSVAFEVWRAYDVRGPLARNNSPPNVMARIVPGISPEHAQPQLDRRASVVGASLGVEGYAVKAVPFAPRNLTDSQQAMFRILLGGALCLLLAAFANIAGLELATALGRSRVSAIQLALGGSRMSQARVAALEGAIIVFLALAAGLLLAHLTLSALISILPDQFLNRTQHRITFGARAFAYSLFIATVAWTMTSLPPVLASARGSLLSLLRTEDRTSGGSRGAARVRRALTVAQVGAAVALIATGLLYGRSYRQLLAIDKGFDSANVVRLDASHPVDFFDSYPGGRLAMADDLGRRLVTLPGVVAVSQATPPPYVGDSPSRIALEVDDRPPLVEPVLLGRNWVDVYYFDVIQLPLLAGRFFAADEKPDSVVVPDTFARRFWPDGNAVGHRFRERPDAPWNTVIGVVGDFRSSRLTMPGPDDFSLFFYAQRETIPVQTAVPERPADWIDTGGATGFTSLLVRLETSDSATRVLDVARSFDPRLRVTLEFIDDIYARQNADTRLATTVVSAFSVLAFAVALLGIYGVMTFLVAGRRREIGIRMALGASRNDMRRLVLSSSIRLVLLGALIGTGLALLASRWIASELYGVSPTDPTTYIGVVAAVTLAALLATWLPARHAARVDPSVTLRAD